MTKRETYKLIEKEYYKEYELDSMPCLCGNVPIKLNRDWRDVWKKINTKNILIISTYFDHKYSSEEKDLLRLLTLCIFIEDNYK